MIDEQMREVYESGSNDPGTLHDILDRFDLNELVRDIYRLVGTKYKKRGFALLGHCILAVECESKNGNSPYYMKLQNPAFAAEKVVEIAGLVALKLAVQPTSKKKRKLAVQKLARKVLY
jgi:hypothetical protein